MINMIIHCVIVNLIKQCSTYLHVTDQSHCCVYVRFSMQRYGIIISNQRILVAQIAQSACQLDITIVQ